MTGLPNVAVERGERWLPIAGFTGYDVSDCGRIRSWRGRGGLRGAIQATSRPVKTPEDRDGYHRVTLRNDDGQVVTKIVHQLVLIAFVGPCPEGMECRHLNGIPNDNRWPENICWGTPLENAADKHAHGTMVRGDQHYTRTRPWLMRHGGWATDPSKLARGEKHHSAKLNEQGALRAIELLASGARPIDIARALGVSDCCIADIKAGRTWKHLPRSGGQS